MWKKVLYFGVAIVIGILVYIIGYSSNQMNHLEGLVKSAIEKEEYHKVPMVWDGCFDTHSIIHDDKDNLDIVMYPATSQTDITFGPEDNTTRFLHYERAYYLYIFNANFSLGAINTGTETYNKTSLVFSNDTESYEYYFVVDENTNSTVYIKEPTSKEEVLLNAERDITNTNSTWNFMRVTFTETMLDQIKERIHGDITKLELKDSEGNLQFSTEIKLDFSQSFFTDVAPLFENYNIYLTEYLAADGDKTKLNEASEKFTTWYDAWLVTFNESKEQTGYTFRYDNSIISPSKIVWQTIGMIALYILVILLFYVLLFHFSAIRRLFSRENYKEYSRNSRVMVNGKVVSKSNMKHNTENSDDVISVKPDVVADENLETVSAADIVAEPTEVVEENIDLVNANEENAEMESNSSEEKKNETN